VVGLSVASASASASPVASAVEVAAVVVSVAFASAAFGEAVAASLDALAAGGGGDGASGVLAASVGATVLLSRVKARPSGLVVRRRSMTRWWTKLKSRRREGTFQPRETKARRCEGRHTTLSLRLQRERFCRAATMANMQSLGPEIFHDVFLHVRGSVGFATELYDVSRVCHEWKVRKLCTSKLHNLGIHPQESTHVVLFSSFLAQIEQLSIFSPKPAIIILVSLSSVDQLMLTCMNHDADMDHIFGTHDKILEVNPIYIANIPMEQCLARYRGSAGRLG
jgi:hypothetical protein